MWGEGNTDRINALVEAKRQTAHIGEEKADKRIQRASNLLLLGLLLALVGVFVGWVWAAVVLAVVVVSELAWAWRRRRQSGKLEA